MRKNITRFSILITILLRVNINVILFCPQGSKKKRRLPLPQAFGCLWRLVPAMLTYTVDSLLAIRHTQRIQSFSEPHGQRGDARRAELKFWVWLLWRNRNELRGLRAKFWHGPSYHAKGGFQWYQHVMLSSIVRLRAFP